MPKTKLMSVMESPQNKPWNKKSQTQSDTNIVAKSANMQTETKIKRLVFVWCLGINEELISVTKGVKHVDVMAVQKKIFSSEEKIHNIILRIRKNKTKRKNKKSFKPEMVVVKIVWKLFLNQGSPVFVKFLKM